MAGTEPTRPIVPPASMAGVIIAYEASPEYRSLRPDTQRTYRRFLDHLREHYGEALVTTLRPPHVRKIVRRLQDTPRSANRLLSILRIVLDQACEAGVIDANPAKDVAKLKYAAKGYVPWSEEQIAQFEARHPTGSKARLAFALALYTGQRRADVVTMGWQHVKNGWISVRQSKTGAALDIPVLPELAAELATLPRDRMLFLVTEYGRPFSRDGFGNWFASRVNQAGLSGVSIHGLRKVAASRLADAGCSASEIASITGHASLSEVSHYTRRADQRRLAKQASEKLQLANLGGEG